QAWVISSGVGSMRCLSCGAEMRLIQAVPHESTPALEHTTFECSACKDIERRLTLRSDSARSAELMTLEEAPPTASAAGEPPPTVAKEEAPSDADQSLLRNAWAMLKGRPAAP